MKFPFYKQHDAMQCGITCLQMICKYYGKEYSLEKLSHYCFATAEGVSLVGISEAATKLGLHTVSGRMTINQVYKAILPCIIYWDQEHFVVLHKIKKDKFYIADPGKGMLVYNLADFKDHWINFLSKGEEMGILMILQPTPLFYEQLEDSKTPRRSFKFLFGYIKQYKNYFGQIILGLFIASILQLIFPFLTQTIVDIGITNQNISFIYLVLIAQLMLTFSRTIVDFIRRWLLLHIGMRINISLVSDFFIKLLKLPMSFFDVKLLGDLLQRVNDHNRIEKFLTTHLLNVMFAMFSFIVLGLVLLGYSRLIFLVFFLGSILYSIWIALFLKYRKKLDYILFERQAVNNNKTYQFVMTMQEIKLQDCEQRRRWEWEDTQAELFDTNMKVLKLQQTQEAGGIFINEIKNIIITVLAATAVINGQMTLGMMLAVQYIIGQLNSPIERLVEFIFSLQDVKISLDRINEIHDAKDENDDYKRLNYFIDDNKQLYFNQVDFKYDPHSSHKILNNINVEFPQGKVTAIVGTSGSGKTTLIKLLLGFYPVLNGQICIGSTNLRNFDLKWWRRQCGVVMQDGVIFSESIARNIAVGDNEIDENRLVYAARMACIDEYIEKLPLKYNTMIGRDGIGLSQGQKQRILIARVVYKNPEFIFLDEATNSLDANNERSIVENLNEFYKGKTVIVVAHRLSTVKDADQIIVINQGIITEVGNHLSLIKKEGDYYKLVKNQLQLGN